MLLNKIINSSDRFKPADMTAIYCNVLFNDALNTFYLWLYGVIHMVKDQSDSERGNQVIQRFVLNIYITALI